MRKKWFIAVLGLSLIFTGISLVFSQQLGTKARIEEKGSNWMLDKGSSSGAALGMEGYLMKKTYSAQKKKFIHQKIAHFKVIKVFKAIAYAKIDQWLAGFSAEDAQWAQFTKVLVPPLGSKKKPTPKKEKKIATGKTQRWYLDRGDASYEKNQYDLALTYYLKVLEIDPDDPGAKLRIKTTKGKYFLQQGDLDYKRGDFLSAYEYYIWAFQIQGDDNFIAAEKIVDLWGKETGFHSRIKEYEISSAVLLDSLVKHCDRLLAEKKMDRLAAIAGKMMPFAEGGDLKHKLETLTAAKEIHSSINGGKIQILLPMAEQAIEGKNFHKAAYIIDKLDKLLLDEAVKIKLTALKSKLQSGKTEVKIQKAVDLKKKQITELEQEAKGFIVIKKYQEAIRCYLEMFRLDPDNEEYKTKITQLQKEKFKYEKFQNQIKARVAVDNLILHAQDNFNNELMQDALDHYIKAYKELPEEGKAIKGVVNVLEKCTPGDAKFVTVALLERKLSKFSKDFLSYVKTNYLGKNDEMGLQILTKITFIVNNKTYDQLLLDIKANLYDKTFKQAKDQFRQAKFVDAGALFSKAMVLKKTAEVERWISVCNDLEKASNWVKRDKKKDLGLFLDGMTTHPNRYEILEGLLNLCEMYMENANFKKSKYLHKKVSGFKVYKFNARIDKLKKKEKDLKKKAKAARKK